jgi:hypothetical protein
MPWTTSQPSKEKQTGLLSGFPGEDSPGHELQTVLETSCLPYFLCSFFSTDSFGERLIAYTAIEGIFFSGR